MKSLVVLLSLLAVACYGTAPPRLKPVQLPALVEGGELVVESATQTRLGSVRKTARTCPPGHSPGSPSCSSTTYEVVEPITTTRARASYDGQPITYGQFKAMTDPRYDDKRGELRRLSASCRRANLPRRIGMVLVIGGLVAMGTAAGFELDGAASVGASLAAGGVASYALGYYGLGGSACRKAHWLHSELDLAGRTRLEVNGPAAAEMEELAAQFNARSRAASRAASASASGVLAQ